MKKLNRGQPCRVRISEGHRDVLRDAVVREVKDVMDKVKSLFRDHVGDLRVWEGHQTIRYLYEVELDTGERFEVHSSEVEPRHASFGIP